LKIPNADPDIVMECIKAVSLNFETTRKVISYIFEKEYKDIHARKKGEVRLALLAAQNLELLQISDGDVYKAKLALVTPITFSVWNEDTKRAVFREHLQQYDPYIRFHSFMDIGDSSDSAAKKTSVYYGISPFLEGEMNAFARWGLYAGTLIESNGIVQISPALKAKAIIQDVPSIKGFFDALDTQMASRIFIQTFLGQKTYNFLTPDIRNDLVESMTHAIDDPESAVKSIGTALEDYIRMLATNRGVVLKQGKNPIKMIGPMIDKLRTEGVLANHHVNALRGLEVYTDADLLKGLNSYRKMPVHGRDPDADMRWSLSTEVALVGTLQLLLSIRSTYHYIVEKKLKY
jgi:hypothetical protein